MGEGDFKLKTDDQQSNSGVVPAQANGGVGIQPGAVLDGKYLVGRILGSGAVGIVFEAKNVELDETVAIKCLRPEMQIDTGMVGRFAREAKAAAAIKSEYVATVYDVGTTEDGVPYIVMEYLEGKDLGTFVAENGTLSARTAVEYALQCCEALAVAHSKGIVHRDIKPENLLVTERAGGMRIVKVLDFGISKAALTGSIFQNELPIVKTLSLMGTPLYMSPEQVRVSDSVDVRSDIWSLGMVIYEVLTGHTAFPGNSITEICAQIIESPPNPIELHRNDLPSGLVEVIGKCLQKDTAKRYQNVAELALALMPFGPKRTRLNVERAIAVLQGSGHVDPHVRFDSTMPPGSSDPPFPLIPRHSSVPTGLLMPASVPAPSSHTVGDGRTRMPVGFYVGVAAVLLLAVVGILLLLKGNAPPPQPIAPVTQMQVAPPPAAPTAQAPAATATPEPSVASPATATLTPASPVPAQKPVVWGGAPRPAAPRSPTPTAKPGAGKPKSAATGSEEPDMGY